MLFRAGLAILKIRESELMQTQDMADMFEILKMPLGKAAGESVWYQTDSTDTASGQKMIGPSGFIKTSYNKRWLGSFPTDHISIMRQRAKAELEEAMGIVPSLREGDEGQEEGGVERQQSGAPSEALSEALSEASEASSIEGQQTPGAAPALADALDDGMEVGEVECAVDTEMGTKLHHSRSLSSENSARNLMSAVANQYSSRRKSLMLFVDGNVSNQNSTRQAYLDGSGSSTSSTAASNAMLFER